MKRNLAIIFASLSVFTLGLNVTSAQFTIKIPNIKDVKIGKPDKDGSKIKDTVTTATTKGDVKTKGEVTTKTSNSKLLYAPMRATSAPVFLKNSIYIQTVAHDEYWKMPNQSNYSSWIPQTRFDLFYNNEKNLNYTIEYFNPDGSLWFSEKPEQSSRRAADDTVLFQSPNPYEILNTKSTVGVGVYAFKITNADTKEILYQGKFKVGKFSRANRPDEKNKNGFYVEQDWLQPFGMLGFHHSGMEIGGMLPEVSVWLNGLIDTSDLEGRLFYKGQQIASTKDSDGASGVADYDERSSPYAAPFVPQTMWKRYRFQWGKFLVDNNGSFNRENYPAAHYADKNPGDYTVKIYRSGAAIRELGFSVGADGKFVVPAYTSQIPMPFYRIILPVKVVGATEKTNAASWKTDAFYGNPLNGFAVQ